MYRRINDSFGIGWVKLYMECGSTTNTIAIITSTINISVTTTDNHWMSKRSYQDYNIVHQFPVPSIIGKSEICYGEKYRFEADGGISYLWSHWRNNKIYSS